MEKKEWKFSLWVCAKHTWHLSIKLHKTESYKVKDTFMLGEFWGKIGPTSLMFKPKNSMLSH